MVRATPDVMRRVCRGFRSSARGSQGSPNPRTRPCPRGVAAPLFSDAQRGSSPTADERAMFDVVTIDQSGMRVPLLLFRRSTPDVTFIIYVR